MKYRLIIMLILTFSFSFLFAQEKVTLQLKWFHQFQFAGYYAAKEKGFYKDLGLEVEIKERDINFNNIEQVIDNKAQYGVTDSVLILYKLKKQPVVIISSIFQHSPSVLISLKSSGIDSAYTLRNKDLMFYKNNTDGFSILAMLKKLGVKPNIIRAKGKIDYLKLINKEVDLIPGYLCNETFYFKEKNIDINIINPANYGFDLYGDMLFTNEKEAKDHPNRVKKFKAASLKGWKYALANQEEIIQLIHKKYSSSKSIKHLRYEAKAIEKLISQDLIPLGTVSKGRLEYISNLYQEYGLSKNKLNVKNFIFDDYIKNNPNINLTKEEILYLQKHPTLRVHNSESFPPYNFNENNQALGYSIDYLKLMGETLGINIEFISGKTWKQSLEMIQNDEIDIIPDIAINEERKKFITFTDFKYINYQASLGVRKNNKIKSFDDLSNKTISVLNKSFLHTILKEKYPNQKLFLTNTVKQAVQAVANGKADAVIGNLATLDYYKNKNWLSNIETITLDNVPFITSKVPLHMGVSKKNLVLKSVLEKVNKVLPYDKTIELQKKWLNVNFDKKIKWTNEEIDYLHKKKELNFCINPNWLPFEKIQNSKHIGMTSEYIEIFKKNLSIPINLKETNNWLHTENSAKNRECDFVTMMTENKERIKYFNFTKDFIDMPLVIATKQDKAFINDISSVLSKKLGMVKDSAYIEVLKKKYPDIKIIEVKDEFEGLSKVNQNELYGFIGVLPVIGYNIQQNFVGNLKIDGKIDDIVAFPMATRNDEPILNDILNKLIQNITVEKNKEILNKWLSVKYEETIDYKMILYIVIAFLLIIFIIIIKNRAINKINLKVQEVNNKLSEYITVIDEHVLTSSSDINGIITDVSQAFCDISGYTKKELIGQNHNIVKHPDTPKKLFQEIWETINAGKTWQGEIKNKRKDNTYYWIDTKISPIFDSNKNITGYTAIRHDISDKKRIENISITDELTDLYNKRYFNEMFQKELQRAKRENHSFAFILLDVDCFKLYNDFYGHQKGDYVLESIGKELKNICKRSSDIAYRIGGEEFAITFIPDSKENAIKFAELINKKIEALKIEHKYNKANSKYITVSIGLYTDTGNALASKKEIYDYADSAMYEAKKKGRNQFILFENI